MQSIKVMSGEWKHTNVETDTTDRFTMPSVNTDSVRTNILEVGRGQKLLYLIALFLEQTAPCWVH